MIYEEYQRKMRKLVFYTEKFTINDLPSGMTAKQYKEVVKKLQDETAEFEREHRLAA